MTGLRNLAGILLPLVVVASIVAMAMYVTGRDNACGAVGGQLEFSASRWSGEACVRGGQVVEP